MFTAKLDACECIQAVEEQPCLCAARLVSRDFLFQLSLAFFFLSFFPELYLLMLILGGWGFYIYIYFLEGIAMKRENSRNGAGGRGGGAYI